jgi:hypothetical protein
VTRAELLRRLHGLLPIDVDWSLLPEGKRMGYRRHYRRAPVEWVVPLDRGPTPLTDDELLEMGVSR